MIIDFHAHAFPDKVAVKALGALVHNSGDVAPCSDGTVAGALALSGRAGISATALLNIATNPRQQKSVNDFAIETNKLPGVISFGSVHPDAPDALDELVRIKEAGLKGVKFHPDYQDFFADDERVFPLYKRAAELGLITVFHAGMDVGLFEPVHCPPKRLAAALPVFGGAPVVAAHFGGYQMWYDVEKFLVGKPVFLDTSYSYSRMPPAHARRIMENHGADKLLFGSDAPWSAPADEIRFVRAFAGTLAEDILGGNAVRLLRIEQCHA
jgi:predicted TIM-barrel fold metal-dependent hydrolase